MNNFFVTYKGHCNILNQNILFKDSTVTYEKKIYNTEINLFSVNYERCCNAYKNVILLMKNVIF